MAASRVIFKIANPIEMKFLTIQFLKIFMGWKWWWNIGDNKAKDGNKNGDDDHKDIKSIETKRSKEEDRNKDNNEQNEDKTIDHDNVDQRANDRDEDEIVIDGNENDFL